MVVKRMNAFTERAVSRKQMLSIDPSMTLFGSIRQASAKQCAARRLVSGAKVRRKENCHILGNGDNLDKGDIPHNKHDVCS